MRSAVQAQGYEARGDCRARAGSGVLHRKTRGSRMGEAVEDWAHEVEAAIERPGGM